jgi:hypothetical protein
VSMVMANGLPRKIGTIRRDGTTWRTMAPGSNGTLYPTREVAVAAAIDLDRRTTAIVNHAAPWQAQMPPRCDCGDAHFPLH